MVTIKEIAREANVSPTTVSLILNRKSKERKISPKTDYSDFRFIPINLSKDHFHETSIQVCRNNYSNNLAQAGR